MSLKRYVSWPVLETVMLGPEEECRVREATKEIALERAVALRLVLSRDNAVVMDLSLKDFGESGGWYRRADHWSNVRFCEVTVPADSLWILYGAVPLFGGEGPATVTPQEVKISFGLGGLNTVAKFSLASVVARYESLVEALRRADGERTLQEEVVRGWPAFRGFFSKPVLVDPLCTLHIAVFPSGRGTFGLLPLGYKVQPVGAEIAGSLVERGAP